MGVPKEPCFVMGPPAWATHAKIQATLQSVQGKAKKLYFLTCPLNFIIHLFFLFIHLRSLLKRVDHGVLPLLFYPGHTGVPRPNQPPKGAWGVAAPTAPV